MTTVRHMATNVLVVCYENLYLCYYLLVIIVTSISLHSGVKYTYITFHICHILMLSINLT